MKSAYALWFSYYAIIEKTHRYSLCLRIDNLFGDVIEAMSVASFTPKQEKLPFVRVAIRKLDTAKVLLLILWETKSIDSKKYLALSIKLEEIGKMLGGWHGQLIKHSSPEPRPGER